MFLQRQKRGGGFNKLQLRNHVALKSPRGMEDQEPPDPPLLRGERCHGLGRNDLDAN